MENEAANAVVATTSLPAIHWVDGAAIGIMLLSALLALFRGFTKEFFQVVNVLTALFASAMAMPYALPYVEQVIPAGWISKAITGLVIFILVAGMMALISGQIIKAIKKSSLSTLDQSLGFAFGLVRGMLIVCLTYIVLLLVSNPQSVAAMLEEARSGNLIILGANTMIQLLPEDTIAAIGLDEALAPAKESAGPRPDLDEVKTIDENAPEQAEQTGENAGENANGETSDANSDEESADLLREGYEEIERKAIEALLEATR